MTYYPALLFLLLNPKFSAHAFLHDLFLQFHLNLHLFPSKILMTFFLVITLFCDFCPPYRAYFTHDESYESYSCLLHTKPPYMHTHMLFSRSYTLLCALKTAHTAYTIYFVLIHH